MNGIKMDRKINPGRLFKASVICVISITVISLIIGLWGLLRYRSSLVTTKIILDNCLAMTELTGVTFAQCEQNYENNLMFLNNSITYPIIAGVIIPTLFFGGYFLFGYIAPKNKKEKVT